MTHITIDQYAKLKKEGNRLGRAGMSQRVDVLVDEYIKEGRTYKGAMRLAGKLKVITVAAKSNCYWDEITERGVYRELHDIKKFEPTPVEDD